MVGMIAIGLSGVSGAEDAFKLVDHGFGKYFPADVSLGMKASDFAHLRPKLVRAPSPKAPGQNAARFDLIDIDLDARRTFNTYIEVDGWIRAAKYLNGLAPAGEEEFPQWGEVIERRKIVLADDAGHASVHEAVISKVANSEILVATVRTKFLAMIIAFDPKFLSSKDFFLDASEKPRLDAALEQSRNVAENERRKSEALQKDESHTPRRDEGAVTPKTDPPKPSPDE